MQVMENSNPWLLFGGMLSLLAALLHIAVIFGGAKYYSLAGAGDRFVRMANEGRWLPDLVTACIALGLGTFALYAFSGAGLIRQLPFLWPVLVLITALYLFRGLGALVLLVARKAQLIGFRLWPVKMDGFMLWSSILVTGFGLVHLMGLVGY